MEEARGPQKKQSHQFKALMIKNLKLQSRQPFTNFCQIFTPIICLIFTIIIRNIVIEKIPDNNDNIYSKMPLFPQKLNDYTVIDTLLKKNVTRSCQQWFLYDIQNQQDENFIGQRNGSKHSRGLLGNISSTYEKKCMYNLSRQQSPLQQYSTPIFIKPNGTINNNIYEITQYLNTKGRTEFKKYHEIDKMPDGSITFHKATNESLSATLQINDLRALEYHRGDGLTKISYLSVQKNQTNSLYIIPQGYLSLEQTLSSAYIKTIANKTLETGLLYMPIKDPVPVTVDLLINAVTAVLFPVSLSLLLPVFLYLIVLEKEQKLIQMMRMNGMKMRNYWLINFIFDFFLGVLTNSVFCIFGTIFFDSGLFHGTGWDVLCLILIGWILSQIGLATFFQVFIGSSRAANIIGYLITIWTNLIGATLSLAIYQFPRFQPWFFTWYPTFAFDRLFYLMLTKCGNDQCYTSLSSLDQEAINCIIVIYVSFVVLQLLGMYLFQVVPQQYGVQQKLTFPLEFIIKKIIRPQRKQLSITNESIQASQKIQAYDQNSLNPQQYDYLAKNQIQKVNLINNESQYALIIKKLRKVYPNGKQAVKDINLAIREKEVFGLLGPNGAGKTTLISMITGIFGPTSGDCSVSGFSIKQNIEQVHVNIGVCPQFDILWPQLTVEEHLYFYARLRGISRKRQDSQVNKALSQVNLEQFRSFSSSQLSGGMKRRLSVGISMVGNPKIVFLDEPTTGLDPENRRNLWEVLNNCRAERALFLTTHLMEQADVLCNRVGIITNGVLRTVGSQQQLKKHYGNGHFLSLNLQADHYQSTVLQKASIVSNKFRNQYQSQSFLEDEQMQYAQSIMSHPDRQNTNTNALRLQKKSQLEQKIKKIKLSIKKMFPDSWVDREINGFLRFKLEDIKISSALSLLNSNQIPEIRQNWGLTTSSLQDVFIAVIKKYDALQAKESLLSQDVVFSNNQLIDKNRSSIQEVEEESL